MMHTLPLLSALACVAMVFMMFGAGAALRLANRTPLGRLSWFARRAQRGHTEANGSGGSASSRS